MHGRGVGVTMAVVVGRHDHVVQQLLPAAAFPRASKLAQPEAEAQPASAHGRWGDVDQIRERLGPEERLVP